MVWAVTGAIVLSSAASAVMQRKAQKKAKRDAEKQALEDQKQARKAEVFAETEGQGIGSLGNISLEVDEELDEDEELTGNLRI
jgi:hypothetical protein